MEGQPPAKAEPAAATAVAETATDTTASQPDVSNLTLEQLDTMFETGSVEIPASDGGGAAQKPEKPDAAVAGEQPTPGPGENLTPAASDEPGEEPTGKAEPAADPPPPAAEADPPANDDDKNEAARIQRPRLKDPVDQEIAATYKAAAASGRKITWAEAERRVKGPEAQATGAAPASAEEIPVAPDQVVEQLTAEVTSLKTELEELADSESYLTPEYNKLNIALAEKMSDLKFAQRDAKAAATATADSQARAKIALEEGWGKAKAEAYGDYPDAAKPETPLGAAVRKRYQELRDPAHADNAILFSAKAPLHIIRDVAAELGVPPKPKASPAQPSSAATPAAATVQSAPAAPPKLAPPAMSPAPGNKTSVPVKPAEDASKTLDYLMNDASLEELDAAFGADDNAILSSLTN